MFDGDVTEINSHRTLTDIVNEYKDFNPSIIDSVFIGVKKTTVTCASCKY